MRKWMRERITRRKKSPEETKPDPAQAPLQPAYFDSDSPASESMGKREPEEREPAQAQEATNNVERSPVESSTPDADGPPAQFRPQVDPRQNRRRRGRGGRGRTRSGPPSGRLVSPPGDPAQLPAAAEDGASNSLITGSAATTDLGPQAARAPKGIVVLAIGLPGSGKSSWFKRNKIAPLSSDLLRGLLFDDPTEQRFQDLVFSNLRSMLKARLIARRPLNYVDATNLTSHDRRGWIKLAKDYGYEVHAVFFDVPLEVCLDRNKRRERVVSEDVMRRMAAKQKPPTFEEGFGKITVVRVKQKEGSAAAED